MTSELLLGATSAVSKPAVAKVLGYVTAATEKITEIGAGTIPPLQLQQALALNDQLAAIQSFYNNALGTLIGLVAVVSVLSAGLIFYFEILSRRNFSAEIKNALAEADRRTSEAVAEAEKRTTAAVGEADKRITELLSVVNKDAERRDRESLKSEAVSAGFASLIFKRDAERLQRDVLVVLNDEIDFLENSNSTIVQPTLVRPEEYDRRIFLAYRELKRGINDFESSMASLATSAAFLIIAIAKNLQSGDRENTKIQLENLIKVIDSASNRFIRKLEEKMKESMEAHTLEDFCDYVLNMVVGTEHEVWFRRRINDLSEAKKKAMRTDYAALYETVDNSKERVRIYEERKKNG